MCILQTVSIIVIKELKEKRGIIMYQTLWNSINKQVKNSHASAAFLAASLIGWTTIGLLAGFLICMIGGMSFVTKITVVLCSGGYTGLILGFFGGIYICTDQNPAIWLLPPLHRFPLLLKYLSTPRQLPGNKSDSCFLCTLSGAHSYKKMVNRTEFTIFFLYLLLLITSLAISASSSADNCPSICSKSYWMPSLFQLTL